MRITLDGVTKKFGSFRALDQVSLTIEPGQILALLGPNGAGKTTLLNCLGGLIIPNRGSISYDDRPFRRNDLELRRKLFFLPDFPIPLGNTNIIRHVAMIIRVYDAEADGIEDRVMQILRDFDLLALAETPLALLSRGQFYKSALAALLAVDPELWLLDEPFASGMDPHGINAFKEQARQAAGRGRIVVYSTQLLDVAERFSDRICVIHKGQVRAFDSLANLRRRLGQIEVLDSLFRELREEQAA